MPDAELIATLRNKYQALRLVMAEKVRRRWAACEARAIGWGGITAVAAATGLSHPPIRAGLAEVQGDASRSEEAPQPEGQRVRRGGGGRRRLTAGDLCCGPAKAPATSPTLLGTKGITSVTTPWRGGLRISTIACKPIGQRRKAVRTVIAMRHSSL
jgi:hypothetical protein